MPDVETNALRRAKTLREEINARTGIADTTVTEGVKRLLRSSGTEVAIQHEAAMMLDIYSDPIIAREEFSRMMDYGDFEVEELYSVFKELEWIEGTGTQYIDTNKLSNINTNVEVSFIPNSVGSIFGVTPSSRTQYYGINLTSGKFEIYWGSGSNYPKLGSYSFGNEYLIDFNKNGKVYINGTEMVTLSTLGNTEVFSSVYPIYLFRLSGGFTQYISGKMKHCKIYDSGLVRDFVPYVKEYHYISDDSLYTEEVGLLDMLNNVFYKSMGPDQFIKGPYIS